jgi:hypothetical protein
MKQARSHMVGGSSRSRSVVLERKILPVALIASRRRWFAASPASRRRNVTRGQGRAPRQLESIVGAQGFVEADGERATSVEGRRERLPAVELERHPDTEAAEWPRQFERVVAEVGHLVVRR